jgi:hypothetical protein
LDNGSCGHQFIPIMDRVDLLKSLKAIPCNMVGVALIIVSAIVLALGSSTVGALWSHTPAMMASVGSDRLHRLCIFAVIGFVLHVL